ncbi:MAG TPA: hypothetical protein PKH07_20360 [bacterium]|nr:hypothetical protein [bacterium]
MRRLALVLLIASALGGVCYAFRQNLTEKYSRARYEIQCLFFLGTPFRELTDAESFAVVECFENAIGLDVGLQREKTLGAHFGGKDLVRCIALLGCSDETLTILLSRMLATQDGDTPSLPEIREGSKYMLFDTGGEPDWWKPMDLTAPRYFKIYTQKDPPSMSGYHLIISEKDRIVYFMQWST